MFSLCLHGFPLGFPQHLDMYIRLILQSVPLTKSTGLDLELVPGGAIRWHAESHIHYVCRMYDCI